MNLTACLRYKSLAIYFQDGFSPMIGRLKGIVDAKQEESLLLDVHGVGYEVFCPSRVLAVCAEGEAATLVIETHVREDKIQLFGFLSLAEREWFRALTAVQGVGAKTGLALLGLFSTADLARAIMAGDAARLSKTPGIGPKLAARIAGEMKSKVAALPADGGFAPVAAFSAAPAKRGAAARASEVPVSSGMVEDAVSALVNLGYGRTDAFAAALRVLEGQGEGAQATLDVLIRKSLKELAA